MQRALIQYRNPENYDIVKAALIKAGREDLIGFDEHCLIPPRKMGHNYHPGKRYLRTIQQSLKMAGRIPESIQSQNQASLKI